MPRTEGKFDPFWSFVDEDMELLQENGLNAIRYIALCTANYSVISVTNHCRYGMMWPGVEPKRGEYNQTYIDAAKTLVDKCVLSIKQLWI